MGTRGAVVGAVVVGLLVGGAVVADGAARERTEERLAAQLAAQVEGLDGPPDVAIGGTPFLTQVMAGELDDVRMTAPALTLDGVALEDVVVVLGGVSTGTPTTVRQAHLTAALPVAAAAPFLPEGVGLEARGARLVATAEVLGFPVEAALVPRIAGRVIGVELQSLAIASIAVDVEDLPDGIAASIAGITVPVEGLPDGVELTSVVVDGDRLLLEADGVDVVLDAAARP